MRIPTATYRLQFNRDFTLLDALKLVPYFHQLGISDLYCSPLMKAVSGSRHGYDVVDCTQINPEIGTEDDLAKLSLALKERGMGLILDIVPNHMSISEENPWWQDVLEHGPSSLFSSHFNIVWNPPKEVLKNKVLLPVLEKPFKEVLENGELKVVFQDAFFIAYQGKKFPLNPSSLPLLLKSSPAFQKILKELEFLPSSEETDLEKRLKRVHEWKEIKSRMAKIVKNDPHFEKVLQKFNGQKGSPKSFDNLENLLKEQAYRLSFWEAGKEEANYQRFFDVTDLVTMHSENPLVFEEMHALIFKWIEKGWVTGLRVDHIDGLYDPAAYLEKLQNRCGDDFYIIVEKILGKDEQLPKWPICGTTGYDFLNEVNALFVKNKEQMEQIYDKFIGQHADLSEEIIRSKKLVLTDSMASNLNLITRKLEEIAELHRVAHDYTHEDLRNALKEIMAFFPVYRTYIRPNEIRKEDEKIIHSAITLAKKNSPLLNPIFDFIQTLFEKPEIDFVMLFQQLTGPGTAKGLEDTALYRVYPLSSLNEVGMDPKTFGINIEQFHAFNLKRLKEWPHTLNATSTHDTKRGEDVRARIDVLSEDPQAWENALERWQKLNAPHKIQNIPDPSEEYLLYQTLIGSWTSQEDPQYTRRIEDYMVKALKEAKIHSGWSKPNPSYEEKLRIFIQRVLKHPPFLQDLKNFIDPIAKAGLLNSLSQVLLKIISPGIPDFYQGTELFEFHLVDPDNRNPVDYAKRIEALSSESSEKQMFISKLLNFRKANLQLFGEGEYLPLQADSNVIAFARIHKDQAILVISGRFFYKAGSWEQTIILPDQLRGEYRDILSGSGISVKHELIFPKHFADFPFLLLGKYNY